MEHKQYIVSIDTSILIDAFDENDAKLNALKVLSDLPELAHAKVEEYVESEVERPNVGVVGND